LSAIIITEAAPALPGVAKLGTADLGPRESHHAMPHAHLRLALFVDRHYATFSLSMVPINAPRPLLRLEDVSVTSAKSVVPSFRKPRKLGQPLS